MEEIKCPYDEITCRSDLTPSEKITLISLIINRNKYMSDKRIGEITRLTPGYTNKLLSSLKRKGFITITHEFDDYSKRRRIYLTDKTKSLFNDIDFN